MFVGRGYMACCKPINDSYSPLSGWRIVIRSAHGLRNHVRIRRRPSLVYHTISRRWRRRWVHIGKVVGIRIAAWGIRWHIHMRHIASIIILTRCRCITIGRTSWWGLGILRPKGMRRKFRRFTSRRWIWCERCHRGCAPCITFRCRGTRG